MQFHPSINSQINGEEIITPEFVDIGIAVQTPKGLMVPIIRNAESKTITEIEIELKELAEKARNKKISVEELTGGTFTITNGGTFGSLMSTPIINPPQSAILGMHNIVDRPVAVNGQVVIRPMMYVALSYDHRIIDGKDSVGFLVKVKELIENPERLLTSGRNPEEVLLGL
jgi:2-oxoglutarate dehydrogenase E2 component (dihydrolipoamide succinyltransferase)